MKFRPTVSAIVVLLALVASLPSIAAESQPTIHIEDVELFYRIYDAAAGHPAADQLQHDYLDVGSDGLHTLAKLRNVTGERIAASIEKNPKMYSDAKRCLRVLPRARERLYTVLGNLRREYPQARTPDITIAVGRGKPVGVGSPVTGVQVGLEALCAATFTNPNDEDRFVHLIAHEYAHVQQNPEIVDDQSLTVLEGALMEGAAELTAEVTSGGIANAYFPSLTAGHEKEIETRFLADLDKTDTSAWLYNSTYEKPGDLGYWVGYRITKAYYQRAKDKRQALKEILEMTDPHAFLAKSGWYPGIKLR
jgi:hypothetical protein